MVLCGTKKGYSMASLEEPFEAPLFLRVYFYCERINLRTIYLFLKTNWWEDRRTNVLTEEQTDKQTPVQFLVPLFGTYIGPQNIRTHK